MSTGRPVEDVWDYPRPPRLERVPWRVTVEHRGVRIAHAPEALRVLETTHPPVYYVAPEHVLTALLRPSSRSETHCEWKGRARYFDLVLDPRSPGGPEGDLAGGRGTVRAAAWSYPRPTARFAALADHFAFYPSRVDRCCVDGEVVTPQPGDFYGGWITSWISGGRRGFKGGPDTWGW